MQIIHNYIVRFFTIVFLIIIIASCSENSSTIQSSNSNSQVTSQPSKPPWSVYITNILEGSAAIDFISNRSSHDVEEERGWKVISFEVVFQSNQTWSPVLTPWNRMTITDSDGNIREGYNSLQTYTKCGLGYTEAMYLPEGLSFGGWNWVKIPETTSIGEVKIDIFRDSPTGRNANLQPRYSFSINPETDIIDTPFTFPDVQGIPTLSSETAVEVNISGFANMTFSNPRLEPGSFDTEHVAIDVTIENLSSDNIDGSAFDRWGFVAVDDAGHYRRDDYIYFNFEDVEDQIIPPNYTDKVTMELGHCSEQEYANKMWRIVGLFKDYRTFSERIDPAFFQITFEVRRD